MDYSKRICRFCYDMFNHYDVTPIQEKQIIMMKALCIIMDLSISEQPLMCKLCLRQLEDCYTFKKMCNCTEHCIKPYVEGNENICRLCMQPTDYQNILNDVEKKQFLEYFPDIDLNITSSVVLCLKCHSWIPKQIQFLKSCAEREEKLKEIRQITNQSEKLILENCIEYFSIHKSLKKEVEDGDTEPIKLYGKQEEINENEGSNAEIPLKQEQVIVKEERMDLEWEEIFAQNKTLEEIQIQEKMCQMEETVKNEWEEPFLEDETNKYSIQKKPTEEENETKLQLSNDNPDINDETSDENSRGYVQGPYNKTNNIIDSLNITHSIFDEQPTENVDTKPVFSCPHCNFKSKYNKNLRKHIKLSHIDPDKIEMYTCGHCDRTFKDKQYLKRHIEYVHIDPSHAARFKCEHCSFETRYKQHMNGHMRTMHGDPSTMIFYECQYCEFRTKYKRGLSKHNRNMHMDPTEIKMHKCEQCGHSFTTNENLRTHALHCQDISTDKNKLKCEHCDFKTKYNSILKKHMISKCRMCDFDSKCKKLLKTHMLVHTKTHKMFKCTECNFESIRKEAISFHMRTVHSEFKMHRCQLCGYESRYKYHINRHTSVCTFRFQYIEIVQTESLSTMYQCKLCDRLFNERKVATKHIRVVHSEECVLEPLTKE